MTPILTVCWALAAPLSMVAASSAAPVSRIRFILSSLDACSFKVEQEDALAGGQKEAPRGDWLRGATFCSYVQLRQEKNFLRFYRPFRLLIGTQTIHFTGPKR